MSQTCISLKSVIPRKKKLFQAQGHHFTSVDRKIHVIHRGGAILYNFTF